jgi:predicted metal-dependent enzyme (double-stranded beta helix superfamily)
MNVALRLDHLAIAARYAAAPEDWPVAARYNPVDRWYHRLAAADDHEVWLLTWLPGQGTELHDHGGSAGAFHVVDGTLTEETVAGPLVSHELSAGTGRRFGTRHIHRITNRSSRPAASIHVYGPALSTMTQYRFGPDGLQVLNVERAGAQW